MTEFQLYPFQQEDVDKLVKQKAVLIGTEMGAGKTHEAIALDELWNPDGKLPTLVVCPLNTFSSWQEKYALQSPNTDVVTIDRKNRAAFGRAVERSRGDVFIMHWDALRLMPELRRIPFQVVIADEVHRASNRKTQATRSLKKLQTVHKLGLSGTATGDRPENLWSVLNWLWPTYYTSYWNFRRRYCIEQMMYDNDGKGYSKITGVRNVETLRQEMDPWYVRHLKREPCCPHHPQGVMPWLPDKTYSRIWVDLTPTQRRIYDQMRQEMIAWIGEQENTPFKAALAVTQLVRLGQIALATPDIEWTTKRTWDKGMQEWYDAPVMIVNMKEPSAKVDTVRELAQDQSNKQFVVFSASKKVLYLAQGALRRGGVSCEILSGDTPEGQRQDMIQRFRKGDYQMFLATIQASGEGVDGLQFATDTAIFLDRSWSAFRNKQAEDRLHRDGSKDTVQIIDIMARRTLDLGRWQKLEHKWSWIKTMLGDPASAQAMMNETEGAA